LFFLTGEGSRGLLILDFTASFGGFLYFEFIMFLSWDSIYSINYYCPPTTLPGLHSLSQAIACFAEMPFLYIR
jgi:hypothetical protein